MRSLLVYPWQMAMEIEQPFGDGADDLPLEEYVLGIERVCVTSDRRLTGV